MKILVTGGAGFIGYHTCKELLNQGHEVVVIDDLSTGTDRNVDHRSTLFEADITLDSQDLVEAIDGADSIIHLAAKVSVRESIESPSLTSNVNLMGFINVADKARLLGVKRIVYASSAAIYGDDTNFGLPSDESGIDYNPISPYGLDKLTTEKYAILFHKLYGTQTIGLRYFNVYGPRQDPNSQYAGVIGKFISKALLDQPLTIFGDGEQRRNFVYVGDVAKVNAAAATGDGEFSKFQGILNVGKPNGEITLNQLVRKVNKVIDKPITVTYQDPVVGDIRISVPGLINFCATYANHASMHPLDDGLVHLVEYLRAATKG